MDPESISSLNSKITKWLDSQGYPLEMLVYKKFKHSSKFSIRHGWHYEDPETNKSREIDIVCTLSDFFGIAEINFVIECKNTNKPWVLFTSKDAVNSYNQLDSFALMSKHAYEPLADISINDYENKHLKNLPWLRKNGRVGYGATQALGDNADVVYKGVLSAVKASVWLQNNSFWQDDDFIRNKMTISFPVVITSSPLFEYFIDEKGEEKLEPLKYGFLFFDQHIPNYKSTCVTIVNINGIDEFVENCSEIGESLSILLDPAIKKNISIFKQELDKND